LDVMRDEGKSRWMGMNNQLFVRFPFSFFFFFLCFTTPHH
jgi:hypothetical protein